MDAQQFQQLLNALQQMVTNAAPQNAAPANLSNANLASSIDARISAFHYNPDFSNTFECWLKRFGKLIKDDGSTLPEASKVRLFLGKLGEEEYSKYRDTISQPSRTKFCRDTFAVRPPLRVLQNSTATWTDVSSLIAQINSSCENADLSLTKEQLKCIILVIALSDEHHDLRQKALKMLEDAQKWRAPFRWSTHQLPQTPFAQGHGNGPTQEKQMPIHEMILQLAIDTANEWQANENLDEIIQENCVEKFEENLELTRGYSCNEKENLVQECEVYLGTVYLMRKNWHCDKLGKEFKENERTECQKWRKYLVILYEYLFGLYVEAKRPEIKKQLPSLMKPEFIYSEQWLTSLNAPIVDQIVDARIGHHISEAMANLHSFLQAILQVQAAEPGAERAAETGTAKVPPTGAGKRSRDGPNSRISAISPSPFLARSSDFLSFSIGFSPHFFAEVPAAEPGAERAAETGAAEVPPTGDVDREVILGFIQCC
ncbi:hypothetical protein niasHT_008820 [Heterodera trifolii]|uniref:DUF7083 domain-containing protein n=1 Tax=Heterodera trifolii TaxID=157864 RepID=A0ABD2LSQ1_9BILA